MIGELSFSHEGHAYTCRRETVPAGGNAAGTSALMWRVDVDGFWLAAFASSPHDTEADVKYRIIEWDRTRRSVPAL